MRKTTIIGMYQMLDSDGEDVGILRTNLGLKKVEKEWTKFYSDAPEINLDDFIEAMQKKHKDNIFERIMLEAAIYP